MVLFVTEHQREGWEAGRGSGQQGPNAYSYPRMDQGPYGLPPGADPAQPFVQFYRSEHGLSIHPAAHFQEHAPPAYGSLPPATPLVREISRREQPEQPQHSWIPLAPPAYAGPMPTAYGPPGYPPPEMGPTPLGYHQNLAPGPAPVSAPGPPPVFVSAAITAPIPMGLGSNAPGTPGESPENPWVIQEQNLKQIQAMTVGSLVQCTCCCCLC